MSGLPDYRPWQRFWKASISARLCIRFTRDLRRVVGLFDKSCLQPNLAHLWGSPSQVASAEWRVRNWPPSKGQLDKRQKVESQMLIRMLSWARKAPFLIRWRLWWRERLCIYFEWHNHERKGRLFVPECCLCWREGRRICAVSEGAPISIGKGLLAPQPRLDPPLILSIYFQKIFFTDYPKVRLPGQVKEPFLIKRLWGNISYIFGDWYKTFLGYHELSTIYKK